MTKTGNSPQDKQLKDKAIDIKGKLGYVRKYVLVSDRVNYFNDQYPNGSITTDLISSTDAKTVIVKAYVFPDATVPARSFTGYSQAVIGDGMVNKTAALENAETSAVGRALGFMGIGVIESIASADEIHKATAGRTMSFATPKQIHWMRDVARKVNDQLSTDKETDAWIETILTVPPQRVPVFKVKDAIDKLRYDDTPVEPDTLITDIPDTINLDNLPY